MWQKIAPNVEVLPQGMLSNKVRCSPGHGLVKVSICSVQSGLMDSTHHTRAHWPDWYAHLFIMRLRVPRPPPGARSAKNSWGILLGTVPHCGTHDELSPPALSYGELLWARLERSHLVNTSTQQSLQNAHCPWWCPPAMLKQLCVSMHADNATCKSACAHQHAESVAAVIARQAGWCWGRGWCSAAGSAPQGWKPWPAGAAAAAAQGYTWDAQQPTGWWCLALFVFLSPRPHLAALQMQERISQPLSDWARGIIWSDDVQDGTVANEFRDPCHARCFQKISSSWCATVFAEHMRQGQLCGHWFCDMVTLICTAACNFDHAPGRPILSVFVQESTSS